MKMIAIHSVPRSGSSWLGQIFNSSPDVIFRFQPLFSYAFKNYLDETSSKDKINEFFGKIARSQNDFLLQRDKIDKGLYPRFNKSQNPTHIVYKEVRYNHILENILKVHPEVKIIGIIRKPLSVIYSFFNAPREFRRDLGWTELEEWKNASKKNQGRKEEFFGYEKWKEVAFIFQKLQKRYPDRFLIVSYSDLIGNPKKIVQDLFHFCEIPFRHQTEDFINMSTQFDKDDPYAVFKTKNLDNSWQGNIAAMIVEAINKDLKGTALERYLY